MRTTGLAVLSPAHLPRADFHAIEANILSAVSAGGRRHLDHHGIAVETHAYGLFMHTGMVLDHERPEGVSAELWRILGDAEHQSCDWVLFDRDEPVDPSLPLFA